MPCSNQKSNSGDNRDAYVCRPLGRTTNDRALRLSAYEFVGQFIGLAIRSANLIPFSFPSIIWKGLVGDEITEDDIRAHDLLSYRIVLDTQKLLKQVQGDKEVFNRGMETVKFVVSGADQKVCFSVSSFLYSVYLLLSF
jgi:hypothetical protein